MASERTLDAVIVAAEVEGGCRIVLVCEDTGGRRGLLSCDFIVTVRWFDAPLIIIIFYDYYYNNISFPHITNAQVDLAMLIQSKYINTLFHGNLEHFELQLGIHVYSTILLKIQEWEDQ